MTGSFTFERARGGEPAAETVEADVRAGDGADEETENLKGGPP